MLKDSFSSSLSWHSLVEIKESKKVMKKKVLKDSEIIDYNSVMKF